MGSGRYSWRDLIFSALGIVGVLGSYISGFDLFKKLFSADSATLAAVIYIIILSFFILVAFLAREFQVMRKEKYANITEKIHDALHNIRNLQTFINASYPDESVTRAQLDVFIADCKDRISSVLDDVSGIFAMLTSTRCRASIKTVFEHEDGQLYLDTLARDRSSANRWKDLDNKRVRENRDRLDSNLVGRRLLTDETASWHYICNDLTSGEVSFESTSEDAYHEHFRSRIAKPRRWLSRRQWVLPYKSTIICAIRQPQMDRLPEQVEAVGLLCVDSESRRVFVEQWDVQLCFAMADALYHPISELIELMDIAEHFGEPAEVVNSNKPNEAAEADHARV